MNDMTVGMENLPNVFIDKIDIYTMSQNNNPNRRRIRVKLCMYDHHPKRSWFGRADLADLKIKMAFRGGQLAQDLRDGVTSLHDYSFNQFGVLPVDPNNFVIEEEMGEYTKFSTTVEIEITTAHIPNLNVYVACFLDGLDFGNDLFDKFYGPMAAEKIFVGGQVNKQSGYFYYPDTNEEYGGPVHGHESGHMEGSTHSDRPHATLVYVTEDNYKIRESAYSEGIIMGAAEAVGDPSMAGMDTLTDIVTEGGIGLGPDFDPTGQGGLNEPPIRIGLANDAAIAGAIGQENQAQDLLADVSFEIRDAIRRGRSY